MNHEQFRDALGQLSISQLQFARLTGLDPRTIGRYALGESPIPRIVELVVLMLLYHPNEAKDWVETRELLDDEL